MEHIIKINTSNFKDIKDGKSEYITSNKQIRIDDTIKFINETTKEEYICDVKKIETINDTFNLKIKKHRISHLNATACYLKRDDKVLMIKFNNKWGHVYAPPGGKFEAGESPLDCIIREYYEETGLKLISPRLQGISYWKDSYEGIIFIYVAYEYEGKIKESDEGKLEWIDIKDLANLEQFGQNKIFTPNLFKDEFFEGKFLLDSNCNVLDYEIRNS